MIPPNLAGVLANEPELRLCLRKGLVRGVNGNRACVSTLFSIYIYLLLHTHIYAPGNTVET